MIKFLEPNIPWTLVGAIVVAFLRNVLNLDLGPETETWIIDLIVAAGAGFALNGLTGFIAAVWNYISS